MHLRFRLWKFWYDHFTHRGRLVAAWRKHNAVLREHSFLNDYSGSLIHKGWLEAAEHWAPKRPY